MQRKDVLCVHAKVVVDLSACVVFSVCSTVFSALSCLSTVHGSSCCFSNGFVGSSHASVLSGVLFVAGEFTPNRVSEQNYLLRPTTGRVTTSKLSCDDFYSFLIVGTVFAVGFSRGVGSVVCINPFSKRARGSCLRKVRGMRDWTKLSATHGYRRDTWQ